ncbi:hypothetical protein ABQE69_07445 [Mycolicibacillus trivialis]|uniref:Uncharacterized protein n=1 Tax=Mycolicibacillus trivialis TaxID=1798 RepID=A0A1X2EGI8_9MYCO|nr:hypothetical protein [Mycolicibacillus trivialis]ORX01087.1 hypothetical protein AWC30_14525 [Mycolicibacillus trivialis]
MPALSSIALGSAPLLGGALLGAAAGSLRGPDLRAGIKADLDLLDRIPADQVERRAGLQRSIDARIDDLVAAVDQRRALRDALIGYRGNWRDLVLFACTVLFTVIWWNVDHGRDDWPALFVVLVALSVLTGGYAARGILRAVRRLLHRR